MLVYVLLYNAYIMYFESRYLTAVRMIIGVTIMRKGEVDLVCSGRDVYALLFEGSPRRCGGQGDILAGITGVNIHWAMQRAHLYTPSVLDTSTCETESQQTVTAEEVSMDSQDEDLLKTLLASDGRSLALPQLPDLSHLFPSSSKPVEHTQGTHKYCMHLSYVLNFYYSNHSYHIDIYASAAIVSSLVTRKASAKAFAIHRRSMTSPDVMAEVGAVVQELFPTEL